MRGCTLCVVLWAWSCHLAAFSDLFKQLPSYSDRHDYCKMRPFTERRQLLDGSFGLVNGTLHAPDLLAKRDFLVPHRLPRSNAKHRLFSDSFAKTPAPAGGCVIELECAECVPDYMPAVTSHAARGGAVAAAAGDEVALACAGGKFLAYPLRDELLVVCEAGRYRVRHDNSLRHLLELGCQENIFEDVLHQVEHCAAPLQGRAYQTAAGGGTRHVAALCFDADRGVAVRAHCSAAPRNALALAPHSDLRAPLSLLGNFNHMFDAKNRHDAERLYSDDVRMNRRLRELFKHDDVSFAGQTLTAAPLLSRHYFEDQNMRVADFASNKVAAWTSVARGNLRHLQEDVAELMRASRRGGGGGGVEVHAGTHGVLALRTGEGSREVFLKPERFPVPRYVWTVAVDRRRRRALGVVVLNDPLVAVSEIRAAVFCASACGRARWLRALRRARRYEAPLYGLAFCCAVHNLTDVIAELPRDLLRGIPEGEEGMLLDFVP